MHDVTLIPLLPTEIITQFGDGFAFTFSLLQLKMLPKQKYQLS